ncbi:MAG: geranylgeranyl reductase family protein [Hyphomicrobiaceae bacterium]
MSDVDHRDLLVIGLGPAGASAAAEAARAGKSVIAVDRKVSPGSPVQCAEFVPGMISTEVIDLAAACAQPISSMITTVERDQPDIKENFPGHIIDREVFDRNLVHQAERQGAVTQFGVTVREIADDGTATLSDGRKIAARAIIGADGPRSLVGRRIGSPNKELVETRQLTAPLQRRHCATDIFLSVGIPGGYGWLFPKCDVANLGLGVIPAARQRLKPVLEQLHDVLIHQGRLGRDVLGYTGGPIPVGGMVPPVGKLGGRPVFLAGDAAGLTNPITGAGIYSAVVSGRLAGQFASDFLSGDHGAADAYADELETLFASSIDRALARRRELLARLARANARPADLRRAWIAYPEYWTNRSAPKPQFGREYP